MPFFYIVPFEGGNHVKIGVAANWETRINRLGAHLFDRERACTVRAKPRKVVPFPGSQRAKPATGKRRAKPALRKRRCAGFVSLERTA
jgi:hypothetical protein